LRASKPVIYSDYRAPPGSAFQFSWLVTWADVQSTINVASEQSNAAIDARVCATCTAAVSPVTA
jgi:hypothetical protein